MKNSSPKEVLFVLTLIVAFFVSLTPAMAGNPGHGTHGGEHPWIENPKDDNRIKTSSVVVPVVDDQLNQNDEVAPLFSPPWQGRYNPLLPYIILSEMGWHDAAQ